MPIPPNITDSLVREAGRIVPYATERARAQSPWMTLMGASSGLFEPGMGVSHTAILFERSGATANFDWAAVSVNTGGGNSCVPNADEVDPASSSYTYQLYERAFNSQLLCWNDLYTAWQVEDQTRQIVKNFTAEICDQIENRDRDQYTLNAGHQCVFSGGNLIDGGNSGFPTTAPDSMATPDLLSQVYLQLLQDGADQESEVGKSDGASVFLMYLGYEQSQAIVLGSGTNGALRNDIRWSDEVNDLLIPFSIKRVLNGFAHMIDVKAPRWNLTNGAWVRVPYWTSVPAAIGNKLVVNPAYRSALYEDIIIYMRNALQRQMPKSMSGFGSMTNFESLDFEGAIRWLNIPDLIANPDNNQGLFRAVLQFAYKPLNPNLAYCIRVKRCPGGLSTLKCTTS